MTDLQIDFASVMDVYPRPISCMRLNQKTKQLALYRGGDFGSIEIWDVAYLPVIVKQLIDLELSDGKPSVESIVWINERLFSAGLHGFVTEHDLNTGKIKNKTAATSGPIWCLSAKPDETQIAAGTEDGFINIFDVHDQSLIYQKVLDRQEGRVLCMDWSPCGTHIASGSVDSVRLWDVEKGHAIQRLITGRTKNKETIVWSIVMLENLKIVSGDSRGIISFWDGRVGVLSFKLVTHKADILTLKLSPDKTQLYAAGVDPVVIILSKIGNTDKWVKSHPRAMHSNDVLTLETFGSRLFSGGMDADFVMSTFPPKTVTKIPPLQTMCTKRIQQSNGRLLVQKEAGLNIWQLPSPDLKLTDVLNFKTEGAAYIYSTSFSPNGQLFAISTLKYIRMFWLEKHSEASYTLNRIIFKDVNNYIGNNFWHLKFLSDSHIVSISVDGRKALFIEINPEKSGAYVLDCIPAPFDDDSSNCINRIDDIEVSMNGNYLAVNSDNLITIYQVDRNDMSFEKISSVPQYRARLTSMNFHQNRKIILLTFSDNYFQMFNYELGTIIFTDRIKKKFDDMQPILGSTWVENGNAAVLFQVDGMYLLKLIVNDEPIKKAQKKSKGDKAPSRDTSDRLNFVVETSASETKYKPYLAYVGPSKTDNEFLVVDVSPNTILEKLPLAFSKKRFGT